MLEVGAEDMMDMLDLIDDGGELAGQPPVEAGPEDLGNLVVCQPPQPELAAALEQFVDGKVPFEDEVAAIFDLRDRVEARQLDPLTLLDGEFGPEDQGPIVEPFANDVGAQSVGSGLECSDVVNRQEGIVILAEADLRTIELLLDEVVAVEVICRVEGEEGCDTHHHGAENFIADIEVVVCEAAALAGEDAVVWIFGGILRHADPEARSLFHTLEDEIDAIGVPLCHSA